MNRARHPAILCQPSLGGIWRTGPSSSLATDPDRGDRILYRGSETIMGWDDFTRRRKAILAVLDYAADHPESGMPYDEVPDVPNVFNDRYELALALQYKWRQSLWSRLELLSLDGAKTGFVEAKDLVRRAWDECAKAEPVLRRVLDSTT